ncbi:hypothetical protein PFISCL1PPCAC_10147 [Pristionchus fissidentatus]|uniref:ATP-dependent RNA helicase n=1 Tax=Pristionchus fissidentatus TaxID=1538716 RepID=A0AAV5VJQ2_9BILA|nr:hypothetical protein PFISCL1PPCAC_10147 [Pristionchus fissidentatus]
MPVIVASKSKGAWRNVAVEGLKMDEWAEIGAFEEWIPGAEDEEVSEPKAKKSKKGKETAEGVKKVENESDEKKEGEGKKKRKRKKKNRDEKEKGEGEKEVKKRKIEEGVKEGGKEEEKKEENGEDKKEGEEGKKKNKKKSLPKGQRRRMKLAKKREREAKEKEGKGEVKNDGEKEEGEEKEEEKKEEIDTTEWINLGIPADIVQSIAKMGFSSATAIQREVIPSAIRDRLDILGAAETGSGKTLAYVIPVLARLREEERRGVGPRALILAPTRELVIQVRKVIDVLLVGTKFRACSIVGGLAQQKQERIMKHKPEIMVATPGRLWALMRQADTGSYLDDWSGMKCLVIDETDRMVEKGHFSEMTKIVDKIKITVEDKQLKMQTLVFSATLTFCRIANKSEDAKADTQAKIEELATITGLRKERKVIDLTIGKGTAEKLVESRLNCKNLLGKDTSLVYLIHRYGGRSIVFCNSVDCSRRLYGILSKLKIRVLLLHAKMIQRARLNNLEKFAKEENVVLLATDVAARGLDIKGIQHVFHYQVPKTAETYIHRSGRTARASSHGLSIVLVDPTESSIYRKMCSSLNRSTDLSVFPIDCEPLFDTIRERVRVASDMDSAEHQLQKKSHAESWFDKAAKEADLDPTERQDDADEAHYDMNSLHGTMKTMANKLKHLMATPLPSIDRANLPNTRYMNADLAEKATGSLTREAVESAKEGEKVAAGLKKKAREFLALKRKSLKKKKEEESAK